MIDNIDKHLNLVDESVDWALKYNLSSFPFGNFKEHRRRLRKIRSALAEKCSAAAYGESQVGKSYLMSSLLSSPGAPLVIKNGDSEYSFVDDINPSGGNNSKTESTGVVTRFTVSKSAERHDGFVKVRLLSVTDLILLLTDSYYNDIKLNSDGKLKYDDINAELASLQNKLSASSERQSVISEDDVKDIMDYVRDVIGNGAANVCQSNFCRVVASFIEKIPCGKWADVFGLLWNRNEEISRLFSTLLREYEKLGFVSDVFIPFDAVLRKNGTILKIEWLDSVFGIQSAGDADIPVTDVYDSHKNLLAASFGKGPLSALIAELTFELPDSVADSRKFLKKIDLLDFPGARSREKFNEAEIQTVLPKIFRRGKVAYLFNMYSRSLRISSVLFCHHNDQKSEPTLGETLNEWINGNIGATPEERELMLRRTNGVAPLFFIATKFNIDLQRAKCDDPSTSLDAHWNRFKTVIPEIIKPSKWMDSWVPSGGAYKSQAFQNIYLLRDFYWSSQNRLFEGYEDKGPSKSAETGVFVHKDYPDYMDRLKESFLGNDFVRKHFANPEQAWNDVATVNNDGSKAIIRNLDAIADVLDDARLEKYLKELNDAKADMLSSLSMFYEDDDVATKNKKVKKIVDDVKFSLDFSVASNPEVFGKILDLLMIPVGELRSVAYDITVCHTKTPKDFSRINFIRATVGINPEDGYDVNVRKLCDSYGCDAEELPGKLKEVDCTVDELVSVETETLTTVGGIVANEIIDRWVDFLNAQVAALEPILPHAGDIVFSIIALFKKFDVKKILTEKISSYVNVFGRYELPNAIADFASITLNNFVANVGVNHLDKNELEDVKVKADVCNLDIDISDVTAVRRRKKRDLVDTLKAFDEAARIINENDVQSNKPTLRKLPMWDNFWRWRNLLTIGIICARDISRCDPEANAKLKSIIDASSNLYV